MLQDDSRKIKAGDTFIALKGYSDDGHNYVEDAIKKGAKKVIVEHGSYDVTTLVVDNTNEYLDKYLKINNIDIKIIGVTGTNGKTTTCYLIYQLLNKLGVRCSYIGTLGYIINDKVNELSNTTPGKLELYHLLKDSYEYNKEYVVMEISSQALDQERVNFIDDVLKFIMYIENNGLDTIVYAKSLWHNNFKDRSTSLYALELMIMFYYDVMKYLSGTKGLFFEDKIDSVQAVSEKNDYISIAKKIEYIDEAKNNIKRNLNVNLLIDKLIIEMCGD